MRMPVSAAVVLRMTAFYRPPIPQSHFPVSLRLPPNQRTIQIIRLLNHPPGPEISGVGYSA